MSLTSEMVRAESLAMRGLGVDQIMAAGVKVSPETLTAIVARHPAPKGKPTDPIVARRVAVVDKMEAWRQAYRVFEARPSEPSIRQIIADTAAAHGLEPNDLIGRRHDREATEARHAAIYCSVRLTSKSYPVIGKIFGRDHATIMHGAAVYAERHGLALPRGLVPKRRAARPVKSNANR